MNENHFPPRSLSPSRIRRAGYPIRHSFEEFVDRYRVLIPSLKTTEITDFKYTSKLICNRVLREEHDWQIGITKVFLKVRTYMYMRVATC